MTPSQQQIVKCLKLKVPSGATAGEVVSLITNHVKQNGVSAGSKAHTLLVEHGYIKVVTFGWSKKDYAKNLKELANYAKNGFKVKLTAIVPQKDTLGTLICDPQSLDTLKSRLKHTGGCIVRWNRSEGRLTFQGLANAGKNAATNSPEREAVRKFVSGLKKIHGRDKVAYYETLEKIAKRCKLKKCLRGDKGEAQFSLAFIAEMTTALKLGKSKAIQAVGFEQGE